MQIGDRQRRDAVAVALTEFLEGSQSDQAISLYDVEFADQATLSVTNFVARLDETLGLGADRKRLYLQLSKAIREVGKSGDESTPANPRSESGSPATIVFGFLVRELVSRWKARDVSSIQGLSKHVTESIPQLNLSTGSETEIRAWGKSPEKETVGANGTDDEMRRLLQSLYVWSCEWFGPVETDRIVADAIRSAEAIPAASQFSPRKFL